MNKEHTKRAAGPPSRPVLPPEAEQEIMETLSANMRISSDEIAGILKKHGVSGDADALQNTYRKRLGQLLGSPQSRMTLWGEEEQGSERSFRRQAETELSGLCDDLSSIRDENGKREVLATHGGEYVVVECCSDQQKLRAIRRRIQSQMSGLDDSAGKVRSRIHVLDRLISRFRKAG